MMRRRLLLAVMLMAFQARAAQLFPLADVRLTAGPLLDAQTTHLHDPPALDPDRLPAPFQRIAVDKNDMETH